MLAGTGENHAAACDFVLVGNIFGNCQLIEIIMIKIYNFAAFVAVDMMVRHMVGIESPWRTETFDNIGQPDFSKSQERLMNGIQRNMWKLLFDRRIDFLGAGMATVLSQFFVYCYPLRGNAETVFTASCLEMLNIHSRIQCCSDMFNYRSRIFFAHG